MLKLMVFGKTSILFIQKLMVFGTRTHKGGSIINGNC
nr:MAG TPA: hypothetical protein [Caudoviricetes sp.]